MKEKFGAIYFLALDLVFLWALIKFWGELEGYKILIIAFIGLFSFGIYENISKINRR